MTTSDSAQLSSSTLKTNIFAEKFLYHVNRDNFNKVSANAIFNTEFKKTLFDEDSLYIIIGTDSGLLPQYIQQQGIPPGTRYIFIELEDILSQLYEHNLLKSLDSDIICTTLEKWAEQAVKWKFREYSYIGKVASYKAICAQQANIPEYAELNWQATETLQTMHFQCSSSIGCQQFIIRQIQNIPDNILPVKLLHNVFQEQTAIILAGGPSLSNILPWVKQHREQLVIFAVSRVARQLLKLNIEPDFICSVDPQAENIDVSKEMFLFKDTIFIHSYHVDSSLVNQWSGTKLYFGNRFPWKSQSNPDNISSVGPTVSNCALAAAHYFGCPQILLAGFDLCYTKEGITHAEGSDEAESGPKFNSSLLEVETYSGHKRSTEPEFLIALNNLGKQAKLIQNDHKDIINLAIDAAKADNIRYLPPEQIILGAPVLTPTQIKRQIPDLSNTTLKHHYQTISAELERAIHHISLIQKLAQKALKINNKMYNAQGEIDNYKDKRTLDKLEKQITRQHLSFSVLVKSFGIRNFLKITAPHSDDDSWTAEKTKKMGAIYYQAYDAGAKYLLSTLNATLLRTQARAEELKDQPDFNLLIRQWQQDNSYKRAITWREQHPDYKFSEHTTEKLLDLEQLFQDILDNKQTRFKKRTEAYSSLPALKTKAILLFKHNKLEGLENLEKGLHQLQSEIKTPYLLLVKGYRTELEGNIELALQCYEDIINLEDSPLLEEALLRISSINIVQNDHYNAHLALRCLSQISPIYLPYYAESCRITGDSLQAIDSYMHYINFFPEDMICKLKIANLYIEIKAYEAAGLMLKHILDVDPDSHAATILTAQVKSLSEHTTN
ncbi:MAG: DUF115 domain-containing protein [Methylococcaceae bacterium]|nr:DUF115 domain-containing protein [Methylococcaceae bacterium]